MSTDHDATNPKEATWLPSAFPVLTPADTVQIVPMSKDAVSVSFGVTVGAFVVPVASLILPTTDGASIGASLLNLSRRKRRG